MFLLIRSMYVREELITLAIGSQGSDEPAHLRNLARAFPVRM